MLTAKIIKTLAADAGFDLCGIAPCVHLAQNQEWFDTWLAAGNHAGMGYLERNADKRFDPRRLVDNARTAVVCAVAYKNSAVAGYPPHHRAKIASYACTTDYHITIRRMLEQLLAALRHEHPALAGRAFVDTAPLAEKQLAVEAGLGWIGRQSLLITPRHGSYVLLGVLLLCEPADTYDTPFEGSRCGRCRNCIESCTSGAIIAPKVIDARRCIACQTIEKCTADPVDLDGWIFGCDRCQSCCPYNHSAPMATNAHFTPRFDPVAMTPAMWRQMSPEQFNEQMGTTPLSRSGLERICGNIND